jgi:YbbR domain-containing protein
VSPEPHRSWLRGVFLDNAGLKLLSLILALTVFLLVNTDEKREITAPIQVAYVLPPGKALVSQRVDQVYVTIRGPWRRIKRLDPREVGPIDLDLTHGEDGEIAITPDMIHLPHGLEITSIQPPVIRVAFDDIVQKQVPVTPTVAGRPLHGYEVQRARVSVDPPMATVRGAATLLEALDSVRTQEIRIDGLHEEDVESSQLVPPPGVQIALPSGGQVQVTVPIDEQLVTRKLGLLPVGVRGAELSKWRVDPTEVEVVLTGNLLAVERLAGSVAVSVTPTGQEGDVPVVVEGAPGLGVRVTPEKVRLVPKK